MVRRSRPGSTTRHARWIKGPAGVGHERPESEPRLSEPGAGRVEERVGPREDRDLSKASMEDLRAFADELEIEGWESLTREELVEEIRRETRPEI
ncbi:MAG TPA: Rho termination factor N-terminal domain-containing protein [Longimicrobiales bacterium]|nr:Rho termination factor N-terminal domain-containing protein [Longimicrobiales bacterium]